MSIRVVTVYETCGKQFRDFEKAVAHREDLLRRQELVQQLC